MSPQDEASSETAPLLEQPQVPGRSGESPSRERHWFSPETLLVPVVFATNFAILMPSTTFFELVRQTVCRLSTGLAIYPISSELCDAPEVVRNLSTMMTILTALEGILSMASCGILSHVSSRHGRKPAFLFVLVIGFAGTWLIPGASFVPDALADWVSLVGLLCQLFTGVRVYGYLVSIYVVDVCVPEERTAALSKIAGWSALGTCLPYVLGGSITTATGNPFTVFYIANAILAFTFIYVVFALPESFPQEKRDALSRARREPSVHTISTRLAFFLRIFEPLKVLVPTRTPGGNRNWRLMWCAVHIFVFTTASVYVPTAWLVLVTSKYNLTPADTGLFFTTVTTSGAIFLTVVAPPIIRFLSPFYSRKITHALPARECHSGIAGSKLATSDHLDVHLAFVSCVVVAVAYLCVAMSKTVLAISLSGVFIGAAGFHFPAIRSLVAGSVDPLKQGEALAGIEMVNSAGLVLSPIVMGAILTATIDTAPLVLFYVHLVLVLVSASLLFLVRDADRYQTFADERVD